jgi:hypothetical protein
MELALVKLPTARDSLEMMRATERTPFSVEVCYCSTLDDCWTIGMGKGTTAVSNCAPDPKPFVDMTDETRQWIHEYWRKKQSEGDAGAGDGG